MIEVYLFLAMFPVQILGMSVLYPVLVDPGHAKRG